MRPMSELELFSVSYSQWSEKARWALDHHGVRYQGHEYIAIFGEPALRKRLGRWTGKISVPLLLTDSGPIEDSLQIALYAEANGSSPVALFPDKHRDEILAWNDRSENAMRAGRAMLSTRVLEDPEAQREAMPPMPKVLRNLLKSPIAHLGVAYLRRKYDYGTDFESQHEVLSQTLKTLAEAMADGRPFVLGDAFTYADICMAVTLQCVRPVTDEFIRLRPATRKAWTNEALASEFGALLDWRDQLYETRRLS